MEMPDTVHNRFRVALVRLSVVFFVATLLPMFWLYSSIGSWSATPVPMVRVTDSVRLAMEKRIELSTSFFQTGLLVLAATWGLTFADKGHVYSILDDWPEQCMMWLGTAVMLSSFLSYFAYLWSVTSALATSPNLKNHVLDIDHFASSYPLLAQIVTLAGGAVIAACTISSGRWLKLAERLDSSKGSLNGDRPG